MNSVVSLYNPIMSPGGDIISVFVAKSYQFGNKFVRFNPGEVDVAIDNVAAIWPFNQDTAVAIEHFHILGKE